MHTIACSAAPPLPLGQAIALILVVSVVASKFTFQMSWLLAIWRTLKTFTFVVLAAFAVAALGPAGLLLDVVALLAIGVFALTAP